MCVNRSKHESCSGQKPAVDSSHCLLSHLSRALARCAVSIQQLVSTHHQPPVLRCRNVLKTYATMLRENSLIFPVMSSLIVQTGDNAISRCVHSQRLLKPAKVGDFIRVQWSANGYQDNELSRVTAHKTALMSTLIRSAKSITCCNDRR